MNRNQLTPSQVLRIGILGAARIAPKAICIPALALDHQLVAVASRDLGRAKIFASQWGIKKSYGSYEELINDSEVEVIYNGLPNGMHAMWNIKALQARKHVISEKPFASNAEEARHVATIARKSGKVIIEAFHNFYSPVNQRAMAVVKSGEIGEILSITSVLKIVAPAASDIRWQLDLGGGANMDVGCYTAHIQRHLGLALFGEEPKLISAKAIERSPGLDESINAELVHYNGAVGQMISSMNAEYLENTLTVIGSKGSVFIPSFVLPGEDDRIIITTDSDTRTEFVGRISSYIWQLQAFAEAVRTDGAIATDIDDAIKNAEFLDAIYLAAALKPREMYAG